jgi:hypothetical protein
MYVFTFTQYFMSKPAVLVQENTRQHQRVNVGLSGVMRIPDAGIAQINTINMSESGILAKVLDKPAPETNIAVYLQLQGVVSNEGQTANNPIYKMQVVHQCDDTVGLAFT